MAICLDVKFRSYVFGYYCGMDQLIAGHAIRSVYLWLLQKLRRSTVFLDSQEAAGFDMLKILATSVLPRTIERGIAFVAQRLKSMVVLSVLVCYRLVAMFLFSSMLQLILNCCRLYSVRHF